MAWAELGWGVWIGGMQCNWQFIGTILFGGIVTVLYCTVALG